jgi:hypothetical protein
VRNILARKMYACNTAARKMYVCNILARKMYARNTAERKMHDINFSRQIFEKSSIKFHEHSADGSRDVPLGGGGTDSRNVPRGETDRQELS